MGVRPAAVDLRDAAREDRVAAARVQRGDGGRVSRHRLFSGGVDARALPPCVSALRERSARARGRFARGGRERREAFEEEVRVRKAREEVILRQMDQHEKHITQNFDVEYEARVARVKEIQEELVACMKSRVAADVELDRVCQEEVDKIQALIDAEVSQRERQDDNIMRALDQYTDKMQASLEIVNSTNA